MKNAFRFLFLAFLIISFIVSFLVFDSMKKQYVAVNDMASDKVSFTSDSFTYFSYIPNVSTTTIPLTNYIGYYLWKENRINEALEFFRKSNRINPHIHFSDYMLAQVYFSRKSLDSAQFYAKKAFYGWPKKIEHYTLYNDILVQQRDTLSLISAYNFIDSVFTNRVEFKDDFIKSYASAKIKYLVKYDDLSNTSKNNIIGKWQRVIEYESKSVSKYTNSEITFTDELYIDKDYSFLYSLKNDSLFLYPKSNPSYILTKFEIKYSNKYNTLILNSLNQDNTILNKAFKKINDN